MQDGERGKERSNVTNPSSVWASIQHSSHERFDGRVTVDDPSRSSRKATVAAERQTGCVEVEECDVKAEALGRTATAST
jgi:hypothetical protein